MSKVLTYGDRLRLCDSDYNGTNKNEPFEKLEPIEKADNGEQAIENVIYQPNICGFPSASGAYDLMRDSNPEIAAYVQKHLMSSSRSADGCPDGDFVLDIQRHARESAEDYADRVQKIIQASMPKQSSVDPFKSE